MKLLGCVGIVLLIAVVIVLGMLWSALALSAAGAWFFHMNFSDAWSLCWDKPWVLFGWMLLFMGSIGSSNASR